jgi:lipoate-protein ligase B
LLLLEHPPTITLGRSASPANLLVSEGQLAERGFSVFRVARGGDVTYHGPGQLVGYPIASLARIGCSVPEWVQGHAEAIVATLARFGVQSRWSDERPGVWVDGQKIAAVGFHLSRRISSHGFALNIAPDLSHYQTIVPCGLRGCGVTSLAELGIEPPALEDVARALASAIADRFDLELTDLSRPSAPAGEASRARAQERV